MFEKKTTEQFLVISRCHEKASWDCDLSENETVFRTLLTTDGDYGNLRRKHEVKVNIGVCTE